MSRVENTKASQVQSLSGPETTQIHSLVCYMLIYEAWFHKDCCCRVLDEK